MKNLIRILLLFSCGLCFAQGVRFGDGQPTIQAGPVAGKTNVLRSLPNSVVTICGAIANATPCTNKVVTYTDSTLAVACSTSTQLVLAGTTSCVGTTDSLGNWGVWLPAGQYSYTVTVGGTSSGPYPFTLATGNGGSNGVNTSVTTTTYIFLPTDSGKNVIAQNIGAMTFTLPAANTMGQAFEVYVQNVGLSPVTIVAPSNTIDANSGSVGVVIPVGMGLAIGVDQNANSPNYWTKRGIGFTGNYTGNTSFIGNMSITGNLSVSGTITQTGTGAFQLSAKCQTVNTVTVPTGSDFSIFCGLDKRLHFQNSDGSNGMPMQRVVLATAYTNATTSFTNFSDGTNNMAFAVFASTSYTLTCELLEQWSATTAIPQMKITGPGSPTSVWYMFNAPAANNTTLTASATAFNTVLNGGTGTAVTATNLPARITMGLVNGPNAGTLQVQFAAQGAGSLTILAGGWCVLTQ